MNRRERRKLRRQIARCTGLPRVTIQFAEWESEACPGCGRPVMFLPAQTANTCGHCHTAVVRGLE